MPKYSKVPASEVLKLVNQGLSIREIKEKLQVGYGYIQKVKSEHIVPVPGSVPQPVPGPLPEPESAQFYLPIDLFRGALKQGRLGIHLKSWLKEQVERNDS